MLPLFSNAKTPLHPKRIVIRMPNWLGDAVMATPILKDIRSFYQNAHITVICHEAIGDLLEHSPSIDAFLLFSRKKKNERKEIKRIIETLRAGTFDLGVLLTNSFSSAWWFFRGNIRFSIGYARHYRSPLLHTAVEPSVKEERQHQVITYKELLVPLGIEVSNSVPELFLSNEEKEAAKVFIKKTTRSLIGINPGAAYGTAKCWPRERFEALTKRLVDGGHTVIFFGDAQTKPLVDAICSHFSERVINTAGKTNLRQLIALIDACSLFVTNDSGPMHIAAALKKPLVALFGSTSDVKTGPYGADSGVIHKRVACSPCYKRVCPIDFRCMKQIEPEEVYEKICQML